MHNIHAYTSTYIHQKSSNTYKIHVIWIEILHVSCMYFVCITLLNVEYNTHTYTYMPHTGICNLIHTAYRISCICMYHVVSISIPDFSRRFAIFFPGTQIAPVGISDPTFSSRSDLWYVPTLRTFLLYKCFFYSEFPGAEAPV